MQLQEPGGHPLSLQVECPRCSKFQTKPLGRRTRDSPHLSPLCRVVGSLVLRGTPAEMAAIDNLASPQVTEISNVKCITRLPKETKRQAVAIIFTDDSARTFTCESGRMLLLSSCGISVCLYDNI